MIRGFSWNSCLSDIFRVDKRDIDVPVWRIDLGGKEDEEKPR